MNKKLKKIVALLLIMILSISTYFSTIAEAAENQNMTVSVSSVDGRPGEDIKVTINLKNSPGLTSLNFKVSYDNILTLKDVEFNKEFGDMVSAKTPYSNPQPISFISPFKAVNYNGVFATLTFGISETAQSGDRAEISLSYDADDILNGNDEVIEINTEKGIINIFEGLPGDINGDGKVNNADAIMLFRYVAGWNVNPDKRMLDCNGDGKVNNADAILLFRYVAGYDVKISAPGSTNVCEHELKATSRVEPTCTEDGNIAYWHCSKCGKYYSNENATTVISLSDTVIEAKGHSIVVVSGYSATDTTPGLTDGTKCSVCEKWFQKQEQIPVIQEETYNIVYHLWDGNSYLQTVDIVNPEQNVKSQKTNARLRLAPIDDINIGFEFLGWFELGSEKPISIIEANTMEDGETIHLYARWKKVEYKINFKSDLAQVNTITYTVDEGIDLPKPHLDGYIFAGWSDENGNIVGKVPVGSIGTKTFTANWLSERNLAVSKEKLDAPIITEDDKTNTILFTYKIGEIRNVPLSVIEDFGKINENGVSKEITKKFSKTIQEEQIKNYTATVSKATTESYGFTLSDSWSEGTTINKEWAENHGMSVEEATEYCTTDSDNWYISKGKSGSKTTVTLDTTDGYGLTTSTSNTKNTNANENSVSGEVSATIKGKMNLGPIAQGGYEVTGKVGTDTKNSTSNENSTGESNQGGSITHTGKNTTKDTSWNSSSGYSASSTVSESASTAQKIFSEISEKYNVGTTYLNTKNQGYSSNSEQTSTNSDSYSNSVAYSTEIYEEETVTYKTTNTMAGYHRWVMAGTADVFATVGYDIATGAFFVNTFSVFEKEMHPYEDYSFSYADYKDNQNSRIEFSVPDEIAEYVSNRLFSSEGLEINSEGKITSYTGTDDVVIVPEYKVIPNYDGTNSVIKVIGLKSGVFENNKNITEVKLSDYITEISDCAFRNCSSLIGIYAPAIKSIGTSAFEGCTSLKTCTVGDTVMKLGEKAFNNLAEVKIVASNKSVAESAIKSGAKTIKLYVADNCNELNNTEFVVPSSCEFFKFNGMGKTFNNLFIVSDTDKTVINRATFISDRKTPLQLNSVDVGLYQVNVQAPSIALSLTASKANVELYGQTTLISGSENTMLCRNVVLSKLETGLSTMLITSGRVLCAGIIENQKILNSRGGVISINSSDFDSYLKGTFNIHFNPTGGICDKDSVQVTYGTELGTLPTPTKDHCVFDGWYTEAVGGSKVTASTVYSSANDVTLYAHWSYVPYYIDWNSSANCTITVNRTSSPNANAATGRLNSGDTIYYGDVLSVSYSATTGYSLSSKGATAITVTGNVTSSDIFATAVANSYTYNIVYKSSNGTNLGSSTETYKFGSTNTIAAPSQPGYNTPSSQSVKWDSTSKTITFTYYPKSVSKSQNYLSGDWYAPSHLSYSSTIEYRNRTANSIEVRVNWTNTIAAGTGFYGYGQKFHISSVGGKDDSKYNASVEIAKNTDFYFNGTGAKHGAKSASASSNWLTITGLSPTQTSVTIWTNYYATNHANGGIDAYVSKSVTIPAY